MRLYEQADYGRGGGFVYSWILDCGRKYKQGSLATVVLTGWKWVPGVGCKGCYVINDINAARFAAVQFGLTIESNGTHESIGATLQGVDYTKSSLVPV